MEITVEQITKAQFDKYLKLRASGRMNMTDIVAGAKHIKETEEVYETILFNFTELKTKFNKT